MRIYCIGVAALATLAVSGCSRKQVHYGPYTAVSGDLALLMKLDRTVFFRGQTVDVEVVARNLSDQPMRIDARSGAPVYLRLWRFDGVGWELVKRYPKLTTMVMNPWVLPPRGERRFRLKVPVEPDWPVGCRVRLTAELNGREGVMASATVVILQRPEATE